MKHNIVFTGGGTAGHVTPNLTLIDALDNARWCCYYIGSRDGIESQLVQQRQIPYYPIATGKLRRYWSVRNFTDPWRILCGIVGAWWVIGQIRPRLVFSKGGFVAFPVVIAARLRGVPVIAHESDFTPGLANRLSFPFVSRLCLTFEATKQYHYADCHKVVVTGTPVRCCLLDGDKARGQQRCQFPKQRTTLLFMGGGAGSERLNQLLRSVLPRLLIDFNVIHLCGQGKYDNTLATQPGYCQFEFADTELADLLALADLVVSRSGANTAIEIMVLAKPHIFIPLSTQISRGDQLQNARYFEKQGVSTILLEDNLQPQKLINAICSVQQGSETIIGNIRRLKITSGTDRLINIIESMSKNSNLESLT